MAVTAVSVVLFALSLAPGYRLLRTVCEQRPCGPEQLSPAGARTVEQLTARCGAGGECGGCTHELEDLIAQAIGRSLATNAH